MSREARWSEMGDMCGVWIVRIATRNRFPHIERQMVNVQGCFSKDLLPPLFSTPSYPFTFMQFDPFMHPISEIAHTIPSLVRLAVVSYVESSSRVVFDRGILPDPHKHVCTISEC
ncbi:hypothetical protein Zmor_023651 [Zophobas morio]|uniref:Uncharacterized protein n=1 Tax=Zophobas morio TaxID=2755281 RepID=A0AA38M6L8_9CUCU|nr:hypothetical protein Zmor_023651 [Zophobas morio]